MLRKPCQTIDNCTKPEMIANLYSTRARMYQKGLTQSLKLADLRLQLGRTTTTPRICHLRLTLGRTTTILRQLLAAIFKLPKADRGLK